ncbi:unnamed protein product [Rotaria magnacalcarata]|uniref:Eukaryotic translation initiation factor 3 subunit C N-terminal domain-containing protein n=1 Tax=Rotaria magnacalcarata TaxID=392030 RepID=A0A816ZFL6_9BILA|nr:unnamed protein product [Rotaria magnacalcarata]
MKLFIRNTCVRFIYTNDNTNRLHIRAILCHTYHLALHDYYNQARDLILMIFIQHTIYLADISTQILYNRTMVQLGLCVFRFVPNLEDMFQLPIERVHGIIFKMIMNEELMGSIKESSQTIILSKARSSKIQNLSIELMEKICRLNEQNEKLTHFYSRQRQQLLN